MVEVIRSSWVHTESVGGFPLVKLNLFGTFVENATIEKPREEWYKDERRRVQYNLKAKNIITSALGVDEYFRVSNCKNAK